ncbi:MAG: phage tail family protein [Candidatus Nanoarchaeia archaeon]|nr:phage tail family protein [Candidatus Nanoarchaeia archaeon]
MRTLVYTNSVGSTLTISSTSLDYLLTSIEGIDIPSQTIQEQKAPFQQGTTPIDQLLNSRDIIVNGVIRVNQNLSSIDTKRRSILSALNYTLGTGTITYTNAAGNVCYFYDVIPEGPVFKNKDFMNPRQEFQITFHCHDPWLYGTTVTLTGVTTTTTITITGDYETPVTLTLTNPGTNPIITCNADSLSLVNTFATGDIVTISTDFGGKSVVKQTVVGGPTTNIIQYLTSASVFWNLEIGTNVIVVTSDSTTSVATITLVYAERYLGI